MEEAGILEKITRSGFCYPALNQVEKNCDEGEPEDRFRGDCWDHVAFDPEHRLVVSVVPRERTAESVQELVGDVKERLGGRIPGLITTDEYSASEGAILEAFG